MVAVAPPGERPSPQAATAPASAGLTRPWVEHVTIVVALLWWAWPMTTRIGGRGTGALTIGVLTVLVALIAQRPWRRLPAPVLGLAGAIALAALLVCFLTPVGFARADSAVSYAYAVGLAVTGWCYARTSGRREVLLGLILFAGMREFSGAFFAWWGHGTSDVAMTGDFPWRNSYAAFLVAPAILGAAAAVRNTGPTRLLGWVAAPLCLAGVVFSTSRAAIAVVLAGWLAVGVLALRAPTRGRLARWLVVGLLSLGFVYAMAGPPLFPHRSSPFTAIQQRTERGETISANGHFRLDFWHEAASAFESHPVVGTGYQELAAVSYGRNPPDWPRAPLAHNSYLQPLADGGLLLGVPFLLACLLAGIAFAGRILRALLRRPGEDLAVTAAAAAGLLVMAHAAIDFDWTQPSNLAMAGLVGALAFAPLGRSRERQHSGWWRRGLAAGLVCLLGFSVLAAHHWDNAEHLRGQPLTAARAPAVVAFAGGTMRDYRLAVLVLSSYNDGLPVSTPALDRALDVTAGIAGEDRGIALLRATTMGRLGHSAEAVATVDAALVSLHDSAPSYWAQAGQALVTAGARERGRALMVQATDFAASHGVATLYWAAVTGLLDTDGRPVSAADRCAVSSGITRFGWLPDDPAYAGLGVAAGCPALPAGPG